MPTVSNSNPIGCPTDALFPTRDIIPRDWVVTSLSPPPTPESSFVLTCLHDLAVLTSADPSFCNLPLRLDLCVFSHDSFEVVRLEQDLHRRDGAGDHDVSPTGDTRSRGYCDVGHVSPQSSYTFSFRSSQGFVGRYFEGV